MKQQNEQNEKFGEVGTNNPIDIAEKEEDLLETLYADWREGKSMQISDVAERIGMKARELNLVARRLVRHGYLEDLGGERVLVLTNFGKLQGEQFMLRHNIITQFVQMVSAQSMEDSEAEACRMEHVMSQATVNGMSDFMRYGDVYDRSFSDVDLCRITAYEDGEYVMYMGLYYCGRKFPRVLVRGYDDFKNTVRLRVTDGKSVILLHRYSDDLPECLWYLQNGELKKAERENEDWLLPTSLFAFEKSSDFPMIEAYLTIALPEDGQVPIILDCMDLNVHIF